MRASGTLVLLLAMIAAVMSAAAARSRPAVPPWQLPADIAPPHVPADNPITDAKVALGRRLFHDADLSINGTMSCATCHDPAQSFQDGARAHPGAHGEPGLRNVPSLVNVAWLSPLTWGNAGLTTLEAQALFPITCEDPLEMGMKGQEAQLARWLSANRWFRKAFPETGGRIDLDSMTKALAAFERMIVGYDRAWDRARMGGPSLPEDARRGEAYFQTNCASCHSGPHFTDMRFHRLPNGRENPNDTGLARSTGQADDTGFFRTPSLRNVAITAPYLHDGSAAKLAEAIDRHGIELAPSRLSDLTAFLGSLTERTIIADPRFALPGSRCETGG